MNENEIRLSAENVRLMEENMFLRDMLNRLIPIPRDNDIDNLNYRMKELEKKIKEKRGTNEH